MVIDNELKIVDKAQRDITQISPKVGWVEHNPEEIWEKTKQCLHEVAERMDLSRENVSSIGITNQRETTVAFSKSKGTPYHNALVWLDQRTTGVVDEMKAKTGGDVDAYRKVCGLPINTYFSAVKMKWLLQNATNIDKSDLIFGTIDTWLISKLTGNKSHKTDSSNASRTMLMDIGKLEWSEYMLSQFEISKDWLPDINKSSSDIYGTVEGLGRLDGVPITGVLGDQQAACLGHLLKPGQIKNTYGTGCFMLSNVGEVPVQSKHGLLTTVCYRLGEKTFYALEGAVEMAGAAVSWAKKVGIVTDVRKLEEECLTVSDNGDVYFVPAFQGIFSPHWRSDARGCLIGMSLNTERGHLMRALIEGPCFRSAEVMTAMTKDSGNCVNSMVVDGGMTVNNLMM